MKKSIWQKLYQLKKHLDFYVYLIIAAIMVAGFVIHMASKFDYLEDEDLTDSQAACEQNCSPQDLQIANSRST